MKFLSGQPLAVIASNLLASDLHLGFELELQKKGVLLQPDAASVAAGLRKTMVRTRCNRLVVLGDFKHDARGFENREQRLVEEFRDALGFPVTVIKGNHDSLLEGVKGVDVKPATGIVLTHGKKTFGLHHGHAWPAKELFECDCLLMGNNHPAIEFRDSIGFKWLQKAWVVGKLKAGKNDALASRQGVKTGQKTIVFPAFSQLYAGTAFNRAQAFELLGPLFKNRLFDLEEAVAYNLDGLKLGKIRELHEV